MLSRYFSVYAKLMDYDSETDELVELGTGHYCLLEPIDEWYGDRNKGLATYISDDEPLGKAVDAIKYRCNREGYIEFSVHIKNGYHTAKKIEYDGEEMTVFEAVCDYISGQISDGWGENGVYIIDGGFMGDQARCVICDSNLYERDYEETRRLAKENGDDYPDFDEYPAFKLIEFNK